MEIEKEKLKTEFLFNNIKIFQHDEYKFSSDSILLAKFCNVKQNDTVLDLCAGSGVIGFSLIDLCNCKFVYFVDILPSMCEVIEKSVELNGIKNAKIICKNLSMLTQSDFGTKLDVIVFNPPFFKAGNQAGRVADCPSVKQIARTQIFTTFEMIVAVCEKLIKFKGSIYFIFPTERLAEVVLTLNEHHFEIKKIKFNVINGKSKTMLIKATYYANAGLKVEV